VSVLISEIGRSKHCRCRTERAHSAILRQLPCSGVSCHSKRAARRWASSGATASSRDLGPCVCTWSTTSTMRSACGSASSDSRRNCAAPSHLVRRSVTRPFRHPRSGSRISKRLAPPCRSYASSCRRGCPGSTGNLPQGRSCSSVLASSRHPTGRVGASGR